MINLGVILCNTPARNILGTIIVIAHELGILLPCSQPTVIEHGMTQAIEHCSNFKCGFNERKLEYHGKCVYMEISLDNITAMGYIYIDREREI